MANNKIDRINKEIAKTREKITEYQNKLKGLEAQKTEAENLEIVQLVRAMRLTPQELNAVYSAPLTPGTSLEDIYTRFNIDHPKDFKGHSLSVSDVVVLHQNGQDTAHYVDSFGYKDVPEFLQPENYLKAAEQTTEQNYNMIDGQINNTPTATELEEKAKAGGQISLAEYAEALKAEKKQAEPEKKSSIRAQLKAAKEQAPKKQARQKTQDLERS